LCSFLFYIIMTIEGLYEKENEVSNIY
jgi:hypothetical protein